MLSLFLSLNIFVSLFLHPLHLSVTNAEYNSNSNTFIVAHKIFFDDFQKAIEKEYGINLDLVGKQQVGEYIQKYIKENFQIYINDKKLPSLIIKAKKKAETNEIWLFFEYKNTEKIKSMKIKNTILFKVHSDQSNMLILNYLEEEKGYQFDKEEENGIQSINL